MSYKHLGIDERIYIENQLKFKFKISEIAKNLNRSISTIIREINRNKDNNHYFSLIAQNKAENRKQSHISFHKFKNKNLVKYVQQKLLLGWSPEQIYGRIKNFHKEWVISFKTIYTWIYFGMLDKVTSKNLRRKGKKRKSKENRGKFNGKSIKERDINVNDRITLGHWEGDTIVSSLGKSKSCLITLVARVSRFTLAILVKNRTTKVINKNVSYYLSILPKNIVKTITFDRGKEFSNWQQLKKI
ncbi:IS30 family transposase [Spiroplasma endosymbiont of Nomada ruficornis]|uniref:IS30 family transposase n=1 Tax=Spiroplasma endosymbiont of Nomada ruficornis TaxID=3066325 RepID=UPI00313E33A3